MILPSSEVICAVDTLMNEVTNVSAFYIIKDTISGLILYLYIEVVSP